MITSNKFAHCISTTDEDDNGRDTICDEMITSDDFDAMV